MKISVSLPAADVEALDAYARAMGLPSRSAAVVRAVRQLRHPDLEADYTAAWDEWRASGAQDEWEATAGDGLPDAPR